MAGHFEEVHQLGTELLQAGGPDRPGAHEIDYPLACLEALRGNIGAARDHFSRCHAWEVIDDVQCRAKYAAGEAAILLAEGNNPHALAAARRAIDEAMNGRLGVAHETMRLAFPCAVEAAIATGHLGEADLLVELLSARPRGEVPPFLRAQVTRAKALVAAARGKNEDVEENLVATEMTFRELGYPYWTARAQLDSAEWLAGQDRLDESAKLAGQAATIFDNIGVAPMLVRAQAISKATAEIG